MWPRSSRRVRPTHDRARLAPADRWRIALVVLIALATGLVTAAAVPRSRDDPIGAAQASRADVAGVLADQLRPTFVLLRRQATVLAQAVGDGGPALADPHDGSLPRWYWLTDEQGTVIATGPAASVLLGRSRRFPERPRIQSGRAVVGGVVLDPLLGATVVLVHAPASRGRVLTAAVPTTAVGLDAPPRVSAGTRLALVAPDGTVAGAAARQPADASILGALRARHGAADQSVRYRGEGQAERLAAVADVGDGWAVVAEGPVPGDGGRRARTTVLLTSAAVALLTTLMALLLGVATTRKTARRAEAVQHALLTVTGHELRTPLTVIIGSARTLTSRWDRLEDSNRKELASAVGRQARQLDRLVERLLHAGRLAAGQSSELSIRATDLGAVATRVVDDLRRFSPLHEFRLDLHPGAPPAAADERGLTQVLEHLLDNAVKYSPDGGDVVVSVQPDGRSQKRVRLSVSDQGIGLPADTSRLFRPFGQSQDVNTRTTDEGGVGVGLSIVKDLVTAMNGTVHAERLPLGSTFVVVLPATAS